MADYPGSVADRRQKTLEWCDNKITYYSNRASRYGRWLWIFKVFGLLFSVCVTVLSGLDEIKRSWAWTVTVSGGLATFFTGMLTTTKTQEYYMQAGLLRGRIARERFLFQSQGGPYSKIEEEERLSLFSERLSQIDAGGEEEWLNLNRSPEKRA